MITDLLSNSNHYFSQNKYFSSSIQFIEDALSNELEDGEYTIFGKDVFARVMTYSLKEREECRFESHQEYVDIQAPLRGSEGVEWMPVEHLISKTPYDIENDLRFYEPPPIAMVKADVLLGAFVMFFPQDGHMPQLFTSEKNDLVKKVVVKLRKSLF